jgi:hypothetical protein
MTVSFDLWMSESGDLSGNATSTEGARAAAAWRRIQDKPTSVTFRKTNGTALSAQSVRLEWDDTATEAQSAAGVAPVRKLVIFGVKGHPDESIVDTNIAEGYRFVFQDDEFRVMDVIYTIGEVQAIAEVN